MKNVYQIMLGQNNSVLCIAENYNDVIKQCVSNGVNPLVITKLGELIGESIPETFNGNTTNLFTITKVDSDKTVNQLFFADAWDAAATIADSNNAIKFMSIGKPVILGVEAFNPPPPPAKDTKEDVVETPAE